MKLIDQHGEISSLQNGIAFYERTSSFVSRVPSMARRGLASLPIKGTDPRTLRAALTG